jgi:hypothetical protein
VRFFNDIFGSVTLKLDKRGALLGVVRMEDERDYASVVKMKVDKVDES